MSRCVSGKRMYDTEEMAEQALIEAWVRYSFRENHGPVAVYRCDDCGAYHFTSRPPMNGKLAAALKDGSIRRQSEINRWEDKWRR